MFVVNIHSKGSLSIEPCRAIIQGCSIISFNVKAAKNFTLLLLLYSGGSKGGARDAPLGAQLLSIWQNHMLVLPPGSWRPLLGEILYPPLL